MTEEDTAIYVGKKDLGRYVNAIEYRLNEDDDVTIKARRTNIRKCVDAVEIAKREHDVEVEYIDIGTDKGVNEDTGEEYKVSYIEINVSGDVELELEDDDE